MNPTIILSCVLALLTMFGAYYRQQPYAATKFAYGFVKVYFLLSGAVLSACSFLIVFVAITENAPAKIYCLSFILLVFGFYIARNPFKTTIN